MQTFVANFFEVIAFITGLTLFVLIIQLWAWWKYFRRADNERFWVWWPAFLRNQRTPTQSNPSKPKREEVNANE
jgi:hypothetical protein